MLRLRGPHYLMNAELEELKTILASEKQFSQQTIRGAGLALGVVSRCPRNAEPVKHCDIECSTH